MAEPASGNGDSRRSKRRKRSRRANPDGTMTLIEHIYEFRRRLGFALLAVVVGGILGFFWFSTKVGSIPSLGEIIKDPYCAIPANRRLNGAQGCQLLQTVPFEAFMIQLKVGLAAGAVLFSPVWLYQIWAFIAPGLYSKERKYALTFVGFASVLFAAGAVLAYILFPHALQLLMGFGQGEFITALTADKYISFMLSLLIIFGISFELPLLVVMLNRVGVVKYRQLKKWRRGIVFALFVFAAFATPGSDPFSMLGLAGALTVLFEVAVQLARLHDRRKDREREDEGWDQLADDEAAPFNYTPSTIDDEPSTPTASGGRSSTDDIT
ncbi:twin-arginine translocase subunit TatC [Amycolatopsis australiensis]|uniref:Sec-independent protein translocase protein TatC n=1 Tax=Amycolatopsis australiensis TaxID=546364 RepID=A0A1K1SCS6_9PSEU|nr:twin-arginine translocase subunit TatC [Amycolatopsis australiensis]SFW82193.1 sec-independent protein translocase protein TatC [Amycolatopsis australiensis]